VRRSNLETIDPILHFPEHCGPCDLEAVPAFAVGEKVLKRVPPDEKFHGPAPVPAMRSLRP